MILGYCERWARMKPPPQRRMSQRALPDFPSCCEVTAVAVEILRTRESWSRGAITSGTRFRARGRFLEVRRRDGGQSGGCRNSPVERVRLRHQEAGSPPRRLCGSYGRRRDENEPDKSSMETKRPAGCAQSGGPFMQCPASTCCGGGSCCYRYFLCRQPVENLLRSVVQRQHDTSRTCGRD
jgi:hypothetical protein